MKLETGLSDFHKMTLTVMKVSYKKNKSQPLSHTAAINIFLMRYLCENNDLEFDISKAVLNEAIQKHALIKQ